MGTDALFTYPVAKSPHLVPGVGAVPPERKNQVSSGALRTSGSGPGTQSWLATSSPAVDEGHGPQTLDITSAPVLHSKADPGSVRQVLRQLSEGFQIMGRREHIDVG